MLVVRNVFVARPGQASKLASQFKTAGAAANMAKFRVLTDLTGGFNRVILEYEVDGLGDFEAQQADYETNEALRAAMEGYTDLYISGHREILRIH